MRHHPLRNPHRSSPTVGNVLPPLAVVAAPMMLSACGGDDDDTSVAQQVPSCDTAGIKAAYASTDTDVLLAAPFKKDDLLKLPNSPLADASLLKSAADVCLVKLLVRGGNTSEPATEPSYSQGIGIEVYLPAPAAWNERIRTYGSGGWAGGFHTDLTRLGQNAGQGDQKLNQAVGWATSSAIPTPATRAAKAARAAPASATPEAARASGR